MDEHIKRERYLTECRDSAARGRIRKRRLTREERAYRKHRIIYILSVIAWALLITWVLFCDVPMAGGSDAAETIKVVNIAEPVKVIPKVERLYGDGIPAAEYAAIPKTATEITVTATAYCNCAKCCGRWSGGPTASGVMPEQGRTIAVDPSVIPMGSAVVYNGHEYIAEDTGSAIKGKRIDIYYDSHQDALEWGVQEITIYVLNEEEN